MHDEIPKGRVEPEAEARVVSSGSDAPSALDRMRHQSEIFPGVVFLRVDRTSWLFASVLKYQAPTPRDRLEFEHSVPVFFRISRDRDYNYF
jgi:hypothetical protein